MGQSSIRYAAGLLALTLLPGMAAHAQLSLKRIKYDSIASRYRGEHAVITDATERIEIKEGEDGLYATTTNVMEKLLLSDRSLNSGFNHDQLSYDDYFSPLTWVDAEAYIPEGNDYKKVKNRDKNGNTTLYYSGLTRKSITRTSSTNYDWELMNLPIFSFDYHIPATRTMLEVVAPEYVKMGFLLTGPDTAMVKRTVAHEHGKVIYTFTAVNVPARRSYSYVPSELYNTTHIVPYVASFRIPGARKDSVLRGTMEGHYRYEWGLVRGLNLRTDTALNRRTDELVAGAKTDREKVARIYDWVQQQFHYVSLDMPNERLTPRQADTVCKRMYGDCKDMSSILMAMCTRAGVPAHFVKIGTKDKPYNHDDLHTTWMYNHMICAVKLDGEWVFLDGTAQVLPLGANREDLQDCEALVAIDANHYKVIKIAEAPAAQNQMVDNSTINLEGTDVSGAVIQHYSGYEAWDLREALSRIRRKEEQDKLVRSLLRKGNNHFLVSNYDITEGDDAEKTVSVTADYTIKGYAQWVKKTCYINMNLKRTFADLRETEPNRNVPMYLDDKRKIEEVVVLNIPKGYRVVSVPKNKKGGEKDLYTYSITYKTDARNHTVTLTKAYELNTMKIMPAKFAALNKLTDELDNQYKETVVLTAQ